MTETDPKFTPTKDRKPTWHYTESGERVGVLHGECRRLGYVAEPTWGCADCGAGGWTRDVKAGGGSNGTS